MASFNCPDCGYRINNDLGSPLGRWTPCPQCGSKDIGVGCRNCGQPMEAGPKRCAHCGTRDIGVLWGKLLAILWVKHSPTIKLAVRIGLGIVIIALVYYLDLLELIGL